MYLLTEWEGRTGKYFAQGHGVRTERIKKCGGNQNIDFFWMRSYYIQSHAFFGYEGTRGSSGNAFHTPGNGFVKMNQTHSLMPPTKKPNKMEPPPFTNHNHILAQHSSESHLSPLGHKPKQPLKTALHPSLLQQPPSNLGNQHLLSLMTAPGSGGRSMNPVQHIGLANQNHSGSLPPRPHSASGNITNSQPYVSVASHGDHGMSYVPPQQAGQYMNHLPYSQGPAPPQVFYPGGFYYFYPQQ